MKHLHHHRQARTGGRHAAGGAVRWLLAISASVAVMAGALVAVPAGAVTESTTGPLGFFPLATPYVAYDAAVSGGVRHQVVVAGNGGIPTATETASVVFDVTMSGATAAGALRIGAGDVASGDEVDDGVMVQYAAGETRTVQVQSELSSTGEIFVRSTAVGSSTLDVTVEAVGYHATERCYSTFCYHHRYQPASATNVHDGRGSAYQESDAAVQIDLHGVAGIPSTATQAVVRVALLPVTTNAVPRQLVLRPVGGSATTLNGLINFTESTATQKTITTDLGTGSNAGKIEIDFTGDQMNAGGQVLLAVDAVGWLDSAGAYTPATPGTTASASVAPGSPANVDLRGIDGLPHNLGAPFSPTVAATVVLSGAGTAGTATVAGRSLAYPAGSSVSTRVLLPVGSTGSIALTSTSAVDVDLDVDGWYEWSGYSGYATGSRQVSLTPAQLYFTSTWREAAGVEKSFDALGAGGVPTTGVSYVALQVRLWNTTGSASTATFWGDGLSKPAAPMLHADGTHAAASLVIVPLGSTGDVRFVVEGANAAVEAKVVGYLTPYSGLAGADHVAVIGDSITYGSSTQVFAASEDVAQLNIRGIPGHMIAELRWWAEQLRPSRPEQLVVNLGSNDAWIGGNPLDAAGRVDELERMLDGFPTASCRYVVTVNAWTVTDGKLADDPNVPDENTWNERAQALNDEIEALASSSSTIGLIDLDEYLRSSGAEPVADPPAVAGDDFELFVDDGIHPNDDGKIALAGLYEAALRPTVPTQNDPLAAYAPYVTRC